MIQLAETSSPPYTPTPAAPAARVASIDVVRGVVMVLMALDHVRDYVTNLRFQPENLERGTAALFATRWVTHFCAPAFFLLAGIGIGIALHRGKSASAMSRYLITRGLWLLVLELVVTPVGWQFGLDLLPAFALVLWALGWSMIVMAALVHLPKLAVAVFTALLIAGHNLFDGIRPDALGAAGPLWQFLHVPGFVVPDVLFVGYPLIPWVAVMALGYLLSDVYAMDDQRRKKILIAGGIAAVVLFVALRAMNGYGNSQPWSVQRTAALTAASFLNVRKYPPSLQYLLMTLGPVLIALALTERSHGRLSRWLAVYGRVPLFFYVGHIFVAHLVAMGLALVQSGELRRVPIIHNTAAIPDTHGVALPGVYLCWAIVVVLMYYPCVRFARLKQTRTDWWIRYL